MICPVCKRDAMYTVNHRVSKNPPGIRRQRMCAYCHRTTITFEITQDKLTQLQRGYTKNVNQKKYRKEDDEEEEEL